MAMSRLLSLVDLRHTPDVSRRISDVTELRGPYGNLFDRLRFEPIVSVAPGTTRGNQSAPPQHGQMFRERWLRHVERLAEFLNRKLALQEQFEDVPARRVRHRAKDLILSGTP